MKEHGLPDSVLTLPVIKLPLYGTGMCSDSDSTLPSHTWKDTTPLAFRNFLILAQLPAQNAAYKSDSQPKTVPPTLPAGQLLGSSRLITKLRTHAERVSRAGQISLLVDCKCGVSIVPALSDDSGFKSLFMKLSNRSHCITKLKWPTCRTLDLKTYLS